jgi:hypothetical protein
MRVNNFCEVGMKTAIRVRAVEVVGALMDLGLSVEVLREALLIGEAARDACTANDTPKPGGMRMEHSRCLL